MAASEDKYANLRETAKAAQARRANATRWAGKDSERFLNADYEFRVARAVLLASELGDLIDTFDGDPQVYRRVNRALKMGGVS